MTTRRMALDVIVGGLALTAMAAGRTATPQPRGRAEQVSQPRGRAEQVIEPEADAALRRMSDYLGGLKTFRVKATTIDEKVTTGGEKIQEVKESQLAVKRPNGLWVDRVGPAGHLVFRYDGKQFSLASAEKDSYAVAPAPASLDAAIVDARDRLHIDAPGADLIVANPYKTLMDGVVTGRYLGLEPIGGVWAHHLAMTGDVVDWQVWIQDGPEPLPLRYVITTKDVPGHPQFTIELRDWQPNAPLTDESFAFVPSPGMKQIAFTRPKVR